MQSCAKQSAISMLTLSDTPRSLYCDSQTWNHHIELSQVFDKICTLCSSKHAQNATKLHDSGILKKSFVNLFTFENTFVLFSFFLKIREKSFADPLTLKNKIQKSSKWACSFWRNTTNTTHEHCVSRRRIATYRLQQATTTYCAFSNTILFQTTL